jgi:hypothetical protein
MSKLVKLLEMAYFTISGLLMLGLSVSLCSLTAAPGFSTSLDCFWLFGMFWIPVSIVSIVGIVALFAREDRNIRCVSFDLLISLAICGACIFQGFAMFFAPKWYPYVLGHQQTAVAVSAPMFILATICFYGVYRARRTPTLVN